MYNPDTDLLFPPRVIPLLVNDRGPLWQELVGTVGEAGPYGTRQIAFILMMARLNGCLTCNADSFRAIHGCTACARQAIKRFHGPDNELNRLFEATETEVSLFLLKKI
jgi:hypothetical protein